MTTLSEVTADIRAVIRAVETGFCRNLERGDLAALADSFFAEDGAVYAPGVPPIEGREAIRRWYDGYAEHVHEAELIGTRLEASGDLACDSGHYRIKKSGAHEHGKFLAVFRRQADASWKAVVFMYSENLPE